MTVPVSATIPVVATSVPTRDAARATLAACFLGMFVVTLDAVVVNVALPSIRADLGASMAGLQWIVDGYTLAVAALLLSAGSLADRVGARRAFVAGMVGFGVASAACAVAPTLTVLLAARAAQGTAASLLMPTSMSLIGQAFPDPRLKARAVGLWALGGAVASSAGPVVGGALAALDWRLIFWINVPVTVVALMLVRRTPPSPRVAHPFDPAGLVASVVAMGGLTYGAIASGERGIVDPVVVVSATVAVVAGAIFLWLERRQAHPMLPLGLFKNRHVVMSTVVGFAFMVCYYGTPFAMSLELQQQRQLSSVATGFVFLPMMLIGLAMTPLSARLVERYGRRRVMLTGVVAMTAGITGLGVSPGAPIWAVSLFMLLIGIGGPTIMPPATAALLAAVDPARSSVASGVLNTSRQVGGALAVAGFGAVLAHGFRSGLPVCMALSAISILVAGVVIARYARG